ncbi:TetR/AcrR family transcriptional regulator [Nocardia anaemiae]|uniref:TetR/AcrR family transcriptional regulator n=1 Tax=Nocardia anaemiae TaxID=263910 RepID=UPI0007A371A4|nr:TetR/AcrR family transcriptional regulator [Nocardia anaemiae]
MTEAAGRPRRTGGRSARVREAVVEAAVSVLFEHGPNKFSVGEVAARAGVHETSIYRRWRTRENLIVDAMLATSGEDIPIPDTGSVRDDLLALARSVAAFLSQPAGATFTRAAAVHVDDDSVAAARRRFWESRRSLASVIIERGIQRGELPPTTDARLVLETLIAPFHMRVLLTHEPIDDTLPERIVDLICDGLEQPGA